MLTFFRRLINSRVGLIVSFAVLILIALAFVGGDVSSLRTAGLTASSGGGIAQIGSQSIAAADFKTRVQEEMQAFRQQQPTLDMAQFVAGGGFEGTLERLVNGLAIEQFGTAQGMAISKRSVDGQIAGIPGLQGPDGKFSRSTYERLLSERRLTDARIRQDFARETMGRFLTAPTIGASQVPGQLALPYASLLLEQRTGQIGFIPTRAVGAGAPPTQAELATFFQRNVARYTVPERRQISYAIVAPALVAAKATPSEAEISKQYATDATLYAATEKRSVSQVVLADKASATALVGKVNAGGLLEAAAAAAGLEAAKLTGLERKPYGEQTSPAIAQAVFGAAKGALVGPVQAPLGWAVIRVDGIEKVAARTLNQVRGDIIKQLAAQKVQLALAAVHDSVDDAISNNATFAEIVADQKLQPVTTPPLLADGRNIADPKAAPDPRLAEVLKAAFAAEQGDDPQLVSAGPDGSFAIVSLDRIVPAAPPPITQLKDVLIRDFSIDRARKAARKIAADAVAKVNKGTPLAEALKQTGLSLPPLQPMASTRAALAAQEKGAPPPLVLLFSMAKGTAKLLEAPQEGGWFVIRLDTVQPGDARGAQSNVTLMRATIGRSIGQEYVQQFANAVRDRIGVTKNAAAIEQVRRDLLGQSGGQP